MRRPFIAANWKMHGTHAKNTRLLAALSDGLSNNRENKQSAEIVILPPFIYCESVAEYLQGSQLQWGAQNVSQYEQGAYTGEIAASMLHDIGCDYVLIGHSERRSLFAENNDIIAMKFQRAIQFGLKPILCVGENLEQRQNNQTEQVVLTQLQAVLDLTEDYAVLQDAVLAYEPIWAIGTGLTAQPEQAQQVHALLRAAIADRHANMAEQIRIVYGGSVKAANANALIAMPDIDGFLVGGASLVAEEFLTICRVAE